MIDRSIFSVIILISISCCAISANTSINKIIIPIDDMVICGSLDPSEAETLAIRHFRNEIAHITGKIIPLVWCDVGINNRFIIKIGNSLSEPSITKRNSKFLRELSDDERNQSYIIEIDNDSISAFGFGNDKNSRSSLGMSYALSQLLRSIDLIDNNWSFVFSEKKVLKKPAIPNRRLYLMNTFYINPGLALESSTETQIEKYVDMLIDAHYSQVTIFQWSTSYLYPGKFESLRSMNEMTHRAMRRFFDYAKKRGLEIYLMVTPSHVEPSIISDDDRFAAKGFYAGQAACWSQPEVRDLAEKTIRLEMEYYIPIDGYTVWFYDPGGCFCSECKENQADKIFDQFMLVDRLKQTISPNAKMEAVLWPTWVFHETKGIDYTKSEVEDLVKSFLSKCANKYKPGEMSVMDSTTIEDSNIYNGYADAELFDRNALLHSIMGSTVEQAYPFAYLRLNQIIEHAKKIIENNIECGTFTVGYTHTNIPSAFVFADALYYGIDPNSIDQSIIRYVSSTAKNDSFTPYLKLLKSENQLSDFHTYKEMDEIITDMEIQLKQIEKSKSFTGDIDWLRGLVKSRRWYLRLAQASDERSFDDLLEKFKSDVGSIPMYRDYMSGYKKVNNNMTAYAAGRHTTMYWRYFAQDGSKVGIGETK